MTSGVQTCPTDVVHAPRARVWELVSSAAGICSWADGALAEGPARPLEAGDHFSMRSGPWRLFEVRFDVLAVRGDEQISLDVRLPFGIVNHALIALRAQGDASCRVTLN
jgi:hypothetical protein